MGDDVPMHVAHFVVLSSGDALEEDRLILQDYKKGNKEAGSQCSFTLIVRGNGLHLGTLLAYLSGKS